MTRLQSFLECFGIKYHEHQWDTSKELHHDIDADKKHPYYPCKEKNCNMVTDVGYYKESIREQ